MQQELRGRLDDGTEVVVVVTRRPIPGNPEALGLPEFRLANGEALTQRPGDKDLTLFETLRHVNVTIIR